MPTTRMSSTAEETSGAARAGTTDTGRRFPPSLAQSAALPAASVPRPRLVERMCAAGPGQVILLVAPAGYSKTTCLREWQLAEKRPCALVSCSTRLNDPAALIEALVESLDPIEPVEAGVLQALAALKPNMDTVVSRLARSLDSSGTPVILALDDVHLIREPDAVSVLRELAEVLPSNVQLAIASRTEPPLPLGRMRANQRLVEIPASALAMSREETAKALDAMGLVVDEPEVAALHELTEGWPAGVYLAGLALSAGPDVSTALGDFAGDDRLVADYLREELLATLSVSRAKFLIRTSILDELDGALCDAVLERTGSARILQELSRQNALIVPLDRRDGRYRCHHLLVEMLRSELDRREPELVAGLHSRASIACEAQGDSDRAVEHAIAAGELDRAGELIWRALPELSGRGRLATLDTWLDELGEERIAARVPLALTAAHRNMALGEGDAAAHWTRVAEATLATTPEVPDALRGDLHLMLATLALEGSVRMGKDAERAAELLPDESMWHSPCNLYRGISVHLGGHPDRAIPLLRESARRASVSSPLIQSLALAQLALIACEDGRPEDAARMIAQAHEQVVRCDLFDYPSMALVFAVGAVVFTKAGRVEQAIDHITHCRDLVADIRSMPPWYEVETRIVLARACQRVDDLDVAAALLDEAATGLDELPDAPVLTQWLTDARDSIQEAGARREAFGLTRAELRTLQYLPTHLSFREIGERLFLSANTVKTQARAVYRKLDASSRAEAVQKARGAGLLGSADDAGTSGEPAGG